MLSNIIHSSNYDIGLQRSDCVESAQFLWNAIQKPFLIMCTRRNFAYCLLPTTLIIAVLALQFGGTLRVGHLDPTGE